MSRGISQQLSELMRVREQVRQLQVENDVLREKNRVLEFQLRAQLVTVKALLTSSSKSRSVQSSSRA
jgi:hypothetical protein